MVVQLTSVGTGVIGSQITPCERILDTPRRLVVWVATNIKSRQVEIIVCILCVCVYMYMYTYSCTYIISCVA